MATAAVARGSGPVRGSRAGTSQTLRIFDMRFSLFYIGNVKDS